MLYPERLQAITEQLKVIQKKTEHHAEIILLNGSLAKVQTVLNNNAPKSIRYRDGQFVDMSTSALMKTRDGQPMTIDMFNSIDGRADITIAKGTSTTSTFPRLLVQTSPERESKVSLSMGLQKDTEGNYYYPELTHGERISFLRAFLDASYDSEASQSLYDAIDYSVFKNKVNEGVTFALRYDWPIRMYIPQIDISSKIHNQVF